MRLLVVVVIVVAILAVPYFLYVLPRRRPRARGRIEPSADTEQTHGEAPPAVPSDDEAPPGSRPDRERHAKP